MIIVNKYKKALFLTNFVLASLILSDVHYDTFFPNVQLEFQKEKKSKDDLIEMIKNRMDEIEFYSREYDGFFTYKRIYSDLIENYLDKYYSYMTDGQIDQLLDSVENFFPNYAYESDVTEKFIEFYPWNNFKDNLFPVESGFGLYKAFSLTSSNLSLEGANLDVTDRFNVLCNLTGYENMLNTLFQGDIEDIINLISKETHSSSKQSKRLIQLFDNYFEYMQYEDGSGMLEDFLEEMDSILAFLFQCKSYCESEFRSSAYAKAFENSKYLKANSLYLDTDYYDNSFIFELDLDHYGKTLIHLPYYYVNSDLDSNILIDSSATLIFRNAYQEEYYNSYSKRTIQLLSYIVDWNHIDYIANSSFSALEKKKEFYRILSVYFDSEEEFNQFVVALNDFNENALRRYFEIWKSKMMTGSITIDKLMEFCSFKNDVIQFYNVKLDSGESAKYIERGSKEDIPSKYTVTNYYFSNKYDATYDFDEVLDYFHQSGNVYSEVLSKGYNNRDFRTGERAFYDESDLTILSSPLQLQRKDLGNGHFIYYYVKPKEYPNGEFVSVYTNLYDERVFNYLDGITTTLVDEVSNQAEEVIIVSLDQEPSINGVYFKGNYFELYPKEKVQMKEYKTDYSGN